MKFNDERYIIVDESGNLGTDGRYFVIAAIDTKKGKALDNIMQKRLLKTRIAFPKLSIAHTHEIKASEAYPFINFGS